MCDVRNCPDPSTAYVVADASGNLMVCRRCMEELTAYGYELVSDPREARKR